MLETQSRWYKPAWEVLGWHIGLWNVRMLFRVNLLCNSATESGAESSLHPKDLSYDSTLPGIGNANTPQLIGALGFTLCGVLGLLYDNSGAQYEASLATFWGSWAFLIGSLIQWYESLDKNPVIERSK